MKITAATPVPNPHLRCSVFKCRNRASSYVDLQATPEIIIEHVALCDACMTKITAKPPKKEATGETKPKKKKKE